MMRSCLRLGRVRALHQPLRLLSNPNITSISTSMSVPLPFEAARTQTRLLSTTSQSEEKEKEQQEEPQRKETPVSWRLVAATAVVCIAGVIAFQGVRNKKNVEVKKGRIVGKPKVGGLFEGLIDVHGQTVCSEDFKGQYQLIYFGFIKCPDICPTELKKMELSFKRMEMQLPGTVDRLVPIFISVDPTRDTPEALAEYAKGWHPRIRWLTGPVDRIADVAKKFRVYFSVPTIEEGDDEDYLVDHSIFFYLMDREGKIMEIWGKNHTAEEMGSGIVAAIQQDLAFEV